MTEKNAPDQKNDQRSSAVQEDLYKKLGVASDKSSVKANFEGIISNEYRNAFVNIVTDPFEPTRAVTMHVDGDGSKFIQRLLDYYENGDENVFAGMVDDALSMNLGDIAAAGFVFGPMMLIDVIDSGLSEVIKPIVLRQVKQRFKELIHLYTQYGFNIKFIAGETADLPYQVKSAVFNAAVMAWADKSDIIKGNVNVGDVILGLHSDGQAAWEDFPNSGIMSNGQTLLRSGAMDSSFNIYSELGDGQFYKGRYKPSDCPAILQGMSVGEAILSPTRQWALVIREILVELNRQELLYMLHGITMNTGGGATKIKNIGKGVTYVKTMPAPSPLFRFIQAETKQPWEHMFTTFNCGIGIDIVGEDHIDFKNAVKTAVESCGIKMSELGHVQLSKHWSDDTPNQVVLYTPYGRFGY